jgi:hypothetical protein
MNVGRVENPAKPEPIADPGSRLPEMSKTGGRAHMSKARA